MTWDLGATLREITNALAANFERPEEDTPSDGASGQAATLFNREDTLLTCVQQAPGSSGGGIEYDSFATLMTQYTGDTKTLLETFGDDGCSSQTAAAWTAITAAFTATFTNLRTTGDNATAIDAFLSSEPGISFKDYMLSRTSLEESIENFIVPAAAILANEPVGTTPDDQGNPAGDAQGADGGDDDVSFGLGCIPDATHSNASPNAPLSVRLNVLDCLVFLTPWQFWLDLSGEDPDINGDLPRLTTKQQLTESLGWVTAT